MSSWRSSTSSWIANTRTKLERLKGEEQQLRRRRDSLKEEIRELKRSVRRHEQAREVVREVGLKTQQQLQFHISSIVSLALEAVFPNPYELVVEFVERRNKTECDLKLKRGETEIDPMSAAGGGPVDVASFALRAACWSMYRPPLNNVLVLDEPFRYLSTDLLPNAAEMLREVSEKLGIQVIMVTHEEELVPDADAVFRVSMKNERSRVRRVQ